MHESSMMRGLAQRIREVLEEEGGTKVKKVWIRLGALSQISADHFREHFEMFADLEEARSYLKGAELVIDEESDLFSTKAQGITVERVEVEFG